jgi:hypothetical protein
MKNNEMCGAFRMYGGKKRCVQGCGRKNLSNLEDPSVEGG